MIVKDELKNDWEKVKEINDDPYGKGIVDYMIKWADLMEEEIKNNGKLSKTKAEKLSHTADTVGITGFMYDLSRKYLGHFWYYGDTLEKLLGTEMTSIIEIREIK